MRPIDADALYEALREAGMVFALRMVAAAPTITPPPNDPLTLEELREMDGEPVWVEHCNGGEWVVVAWNIHDEIAGARQARLDADNYGSDGLGGWLAYRRKPEEGTP